MAAGWAVELGMLKLLGIIRRALRGAFSSHVTRRTCIIRMRPLATHAAACPDPSATTKGFVHA